MPEAPAQLRIAGIVLAAGRSRRMGTNKLLLKVDGETLIRRACRTAVAGGADPLIVAVAENSALVREELAGLPCEFAEVTAADAPMSESIRCGLEHLPSSVDAVIILLADMVSVTEVMVRDLIDAATASLAPLIVSRYREVTAPPILFKRGLLAELSAAQGEGCGKAVVQRHRQEALFLDWPAAALADIDTPQDYASITQDGTRFQPASNSRSSSR